MKDQMNKTIRNQSGFSLIELMIVVAIIGILATIAVPNFNRFTGKAKQQEAKAAMSAIYSGEKAFFAEWSTYVGDFRDIGYTPEGKFNYRVGFGAVGINPTSVVGYQPSTVNGGAGTCFNNWVAGCFPGVTLTASAGATAVLPATTVPPTANTFVVGAASFLRALDTWTMNHSKTFIQVADGI